MNSKVVSILATAVVACSSAAQDAKPAPAPFFTNFTITENVGVYDRKGDVSTVTAFNTIIGVKAIGLDWEVVAPIYMSDSSGYGSVEVNTAWEAISGANFLGSKAAANLKGGLFLPVGSNGYDATELIPHLGGNVILDYGAWSVSQSADWLFCGNGSMYNPLLGNVSEDLTTLVTGIDYHLSNSLTVGADLEQYYLAGGDGTVLVTPNLNWNVSSGVDVSVGVGIPVSQELPVENDLVVNAGVSFKF